MMKKKKIGAIAGIASALLLAGAAILILRGWRTQTADNGGLVIPEAGTAGGYEISSAGFYCRLVVDGQYKYSCFEANGRNVEFYAGPTEMVIVDADNGAVSCYRETFEDSGQTYTNPLCHIYEEMKDLTFSRIDSDAEYTVYEAVRVVTVENQKQIDYRAYTLELDWTDGRHYTFAYYTYADGACLISADAPDEINPLLNADTDWTIDLERKTAVNSRSGETVPFTIAGSFAGKGLSPNGSSPDDVTEEVYYTYAYTDRGAGTIVKLRFSREESATDVVIISDPEITKPVITDDMAEMDRESLQAVMLLLTALESLI